MDSDEYEEAIERMKTFNAKSDKALAVKLMDETRQMRREWVSHENPTIKEIMNIFPLLKDPHIVRALRKT